MKLKNKCNKKKIQNKINVNKKMKLNNLIYYQLNN